MFTNLALEEYAKNSKINRDENSFLIIFPATTYFTVARFNSC